MDNYIKSFLDKQYSALSHISLWFSLFVPGLAGVLIVALLSMTGREISIIPAILFIALFLGRMLLLLIKEDIALYAYYGANFLASSIMWFYASFLFLTLCSVSNYINSAIYFIIFIFVALIAWKWTFSCIKKGLYSRTDEKKATIKGGGYIGASASILICALLSRSPIENISYFFYSVCMLFMGGIFLLLAVRVLTAIYLLIRQTK